MKKEQIRLQGHLASGEKKKKKKGTPTRWNHRGKGARVNAQGDARLPLIVDYPGRRTTSVGKR